MALAWDHLSLYAESLLGISDNAGGRGTSAREPVDGVRIFHKNGRTEYTKDGVFISHGFALISIKLLPARVL